MIGTGAISRMHAQAYKNIGFELTVCTDINQEYGRKFAEQWGARFVPTYEEVCRHPKVDYVDVCTFPDFRLEPIEICAETGKHVQVQKPISTSLEAARRMIETARRGGILLGVLRLVGFFELRVRDGVPVHLRGHIRGRSVPARNTGAENDCAGGENGKDGLHEGELLL